VCLYVQDRTDPAVSAHVAFHISRDSSLPLHAQLLNELRRAILSDRLAPHQRLPGEPQLASQLDVSRATVRQAWREAEDEKLIYRVPGKGTYVAAPTQRQPPRPLVGFLIPAFRSTFDSRLLSGAESVLRARGYRLQFAHTEREVGQENQLLQEMWSEGVAGVLMWPAMGGQTGRVLAKAQNSLRPVVFMDRPIPGLGFPCVAAEHYQGGLLAVRHLTSLGHRRVAFLSRPHLDLWPIAERYRAYQDAMYEAGLEPLAPILVGAEAELGTREAQEQYARARGQEITPLVDILRQDGRPTALFAENDLMALQALQAARHAGLRVPDDLSIVGFDDLDLVSQINSLLTTVRQDPTMIGARAAQCLLNLISGESVCEKLDLLPTQLIVRRSTATPPGRAAHRRDEFRMRAERR
jgi:GntR family transcriptional regulator of arabinose operon